jgi:uncharacterized cupredoxin-like copper-binding protein
VLVVVAVLGVVTGCTPGGPSATPPISPGTVGAPRDVNLITRDYSFVPDVLDLVPGETIRLHVINGGLLVHEAVIGGAAVQDAWEAAEAATAGAPPGPTPKVSVPPDVAGLRIVVESGQLSDVLWTVPATAADAPSWIVGCHIPGHWAKGMQIPVRWVEPGTAPEAGSASG